MTVPFQTHAVSNPAPLNTDPRDSMSQDQVLMAWDNLKKRLADLKEQELDMRKYVVKRAFPAAQEGTNTTDLGNGYQLKAAVKFNYKLLDNDKVNDCLTRIRKIGNQGTFIADRLVSWTPHFLLTEYRELQEGATDEHKNILKIVNEMLEITDAAPTLEIKAPKVKK